MYQKKKKLINFRPPVKVSCLPVWPKWPNINNAITKRLQYAGMESRHVISKVEKSWPTAGAAPSPLSPQVALNKQNIIYIVPKINTVRHIKLSAIPYFWTRNSLVMSELDRGPPYVGVECSHQPISAVNPWYILKWAFSLPGGMGQLQIWFNLSMIFHSDARIQMSWNESN